MPSISVAPVEHGHRWQANAPWGVDDAARAKWIGGCKFTVQSYVDAENGFGAKIRSQQSAIYPREGRMDFDETGFPVRLVLRANGGGWQVRTLQLQSSKVQ